MGPQEMKDTVRRFVTGIFDETNFGLVEEMTTDGFTFSLPRVGTITKEAFVETMSAYRSAYSVVRNTFEEQVAEGDMVVTKGTSHVTQAESAVEPGVAPQSASVPWVMFTRFEGDRIAENWELWDELGSNIQLGVGPGSE